MGFEFDRDAVEKRRGSIDINLFQGYDVRGDAQPHAGRAEPNFLPEDGYLIAEALGADFARRAAERRPGHQPRALVTGDHRPSTEGLRQAAVAGLVRTGFAVDYTEEPVPTGATSREALVGDYDVTIQITGSHNPSYNNGMKITTKQDDAGFHDPGGAPSALFGNKRLRPFELIHLHDLIRAGRPDERPGGSQRAVTGVVDRYQQAFLKRFQSDLGAAAGRLRVIVDSGNGLGAAILPILDGLGVEVHAMYSELDGTFPNHPADPSKPDGVRAAQDAVRERNASLAEGEVPWIALAFDGDGDRCGFIDEDGEVLYPERILVVLYRRFLLENRDALTALGRRDTGVELALDVRASGVVRDILARYRDAGLAVDGRFIPAGYPSHRKFVRQQIAHVRQVAEGAPAEEAALLGRLQESYTSAEASGHFFYSTAPDSPYPDLMIDDGIFAALKMFQILASLGEFEAAEPDSGLEAGRERYELRDLFGSIAWKPVSDEIRGSAPLEDKEKFAIVHAVEKTIRDGGGGFGQEIARVIGCDEIEDGVRVEFVDGSFLLVRASNTSPKFTYKFEADTQERLVEVIGEGLRLVEPYAARGAGLDDLRAELDRQRGQGAG